MLKTSGNRAVQQSKEGWLPGHSIIARQTQRSGVQNVHRYGDRPTGWIQYLIRSAKRPVDKLFLNPEEGRGWGKKNRKSVRKEGSDSSQPRDNKRETFWSLGIQATLRCWQKYSSLTAGNGKHKRDSARMTEYARLK